MEGVQNLLLFAWGQEAEAKGKKSFVSAFPKLRVRTQNGSQTRLNWVARWQNNLQNNTDL